MITDIHKIGTEIRCEHCDLSADYLTTVESETFREHVYRCPDGHPSSVSEDTGGYTPAEVQRPGA
jgi:hypothetical protein